MRHRGKIDRFRSGGYDRDAEISNSNFHQQNDGLRKELDPEQLFIDLCFLICESRQPDFSERGRVQGPHCPLLIGKTNENNDQEKQAVAGATIGKSIARHICDESSDVCAKARQMETELRQLWTRGIPACLTVSLLPDECSKLDSCLTEALILEKWTIQSVSKRTREHKVLPGQFLLQAVRSHLHFSQLSAWLIASQGKVPKNILYRVCLPGESETDVAHESTSSITKLKNVSLRSESTEFIMEKHQFPLCSTGKNLLLNVTVESVMRSELVPFRSCGCLRPSTSGVNLQLVCEANRKNSEASTLSSPSIGSVQTPETSSNSSVKLDDREILPDEPESPMSPLGTSRSESYNSFCEDRSNTPPPPPRADPVNDTSAHQVSFVPLALPQSVASTASASTSSIFSSSNNPMQATYATNPLFDMSPNSQPSFFSAKSHLKNRVDALRNEASLLSAKLRTLSSNSTSMTSTSSFLGGATKSSIGSSGRFLHLPQSDTATSHRSSGIGKAKFFLADDDDESNVDDETRNRRSQFTDGYRQAEARNATKRILFGDGYSFDTDDCDDYTGGITFDESNLMISKLSDNSEDTEINRGDASDQQSNEKLTGNVSKFVSSSSGRKSKRVVAPSAFGAVQFHPKTGLPLSSSPAPLKRNHNSFNYDPCITSVSTLKSAFYHYDHESGGSSDSDSGFPLCKSAPASTNLLGSFEESALNGRIKPFGSVDGFTLELGASGAFCPTHVTLPVTTLFFNVSDDNAPSPYFGLCSLESVGRRGYYVPKKGSVQTTLFNPQGTVVKMFVVKYDLCDMPPACQTFVRQRTFFMPSSASLRDAMENRSWLRYLIHLRFASSSSGKMFLHTDIRMLFSRKSELESYNLNCVDGNHSKRSEIDEKMDTFELRSFTEMPKDPKYSPRKISRK